MPGLPGSGSPTGSVGGFQGIAAILTRLPYDSEMTDEKRRNRMISLRLSEEEYATLIQVYRNHGARSLSDFARLAMVRVAKVDGNGSSLLAKVEQLSFRINELEAKFARFREAGE